LQNKYQNQTGLKNLKIEFNNLIGYFIEVKSDLATKLKACGNFEIKQNLTNHVRFSTADLKKCELEINDLTNKILALEGEILGNLSAEIFSKLNHIKNSIKLVAKLDLFSSFAILALEKNYSCPQFIESRCLKIKGGRNPIIEKFKNNFISNDCILNNEQRIWLVSGANMAGKSTFLRQNALIVIMAHIGCFVPADEVKIGIVKQIFTRIGLADNLAKNQSSFMLEMSEIAEILIAADQNSLVIIDEIGNSTTSKYGIALAFGIINYLHNFNFSLALISTHHQKLCTLAQNLSALQNYQMMVNSKNEGIEFSHKIVPGIASDILSIEVAKMTKLPAKVIEIAKSFFI
jgi:DNA mismatch repair protein MutS